MPRMLAIAEQRVTLDARQAYLVSLSARRTAAQASRVAFWVFEHVADEGRFIEFIEGADEQAVAAACANNASLAMWREVGAG